MSTKQEKVDISPVLFMTVDGEPMSFYMRPGPVKRKLQPLITAGGGILSKFQQPGAILLIEPAERGSVTHSTAHWFVSTQYIYDCIEKDEQLNLEDYRFKPEVVQRQSARLNNAKEGSNGLSGGRIAFTNEDDAAILTYVSKHTTEIGGNRLWQEMEKKCVTGHSWQSMKYRYRVRLAKKRSEVVEVATAEEDADTAEGENEVEGVQETEGEKHISVEDGESPQTHSKEDLTQIDPQPIPTESMQSEISEAQTSICPQGEVEPVNPQTDEEAAEGTKVETVDAETYTPSQPEGSCSDPLTDLHPIPAESTDLETDEPQAVVSLQTESVPEDSLTDQPVSLSSTSSQEEPIEKMRTSPMPEQPQRQLTRRQLQLEESSSPEPYGKKVRLRNSSISAEQLSPSLKPWNETKSAVKSALQKDNTVDEPPSKKARGMSVAGVAEGQQEERETFPISETTQAVPQKGEKKKQKRKLGILEMASKEFEDESEPDEDHDEAPDLQTSTETATTKPVGTEPRLPSPDSAASPGSSPEPGPSLQQNMQDPQASSSNCLPTAGCAEPAATKTVHATSKPHLFIFESETQEDDSQSLFGDSPAAPANLQPRVSKDTAFSLTQGQLEEDKTRIRELMKETNKDLVTVTKALLKTSGDFSGALDLLLSPSSISGRFWQCCDDNRLLSSDPGVRQQLQEKYGEELVAKRIVFLELEG